MNGMPDALTPPRATYRLQLHAGFTFADAERTVPYLAGLGISHVYTSPILTARTGSTHFYDAVDVERISPELGGDDGFLSFAAALSRHGLGLIVDIVPNHVGTGPENPWWTSVLAYGPHSPHAAAFDIDWSRPGADGRLLLPVLGTPYGEALHSAAIRPAWDPDHGGLVAVAGGTPYPLAPSSWAPILEHAAREVPDAAPALRSLASAAALAGEAGPAARVEAGEAVRRDVAKALADPGLARAFAAALEGFAGTPGKPDSLTAWHDVLETQFWRLAWWRVAGSDINYRRFFEENGLAGVRVEDPGIFEATHAKILEHVRAGRIQGLRVDHVDGLADPSGYLARLREAVGEGCYLVVEKILEPGEALPPWPIQGTTGYDALGWLDGILVDRGARETFEAVAREAGGDADFAAALRAIRRQTLARGFASEREVIVAGLVRLASRDIATRDLTAGLLRPALEDILACFPVYRTYRDAAPAQEADRHAIQTALDGALATTVQPDTAAHRFVADILLSPSDDPDLRTIVRRLEQLTGPLMAKSLEDTLFFRWLPLIALDEVGGDPPAFGMDVAAFHAAVAARARDWPHAMVATATHDTKRGEDARARLAALTLDPEGWRDAVARFEALCAEADADSSRPDRLDRLMLLQTVLGAWPTALLPGGADAREGSAWTAFAARIRQAMTKALREAKRHTSWIGPDEAYEGAAMMLVDALLAPGSPFTEALGGFAARLAEAGMRASLVRTAVKLTMPGVPDTYQGAEGWDVSLVDPDNRRPVDYPRLASGLEDASPLADLLGRWQDGRIKQRIVRLLLAERAAAPDLFAAGTYEPIEISGAAAGRAIAFARRSGADRLVTLADLRPGASPGSLSGTTVGRLDGRWRDVLTGRSVTAQDGRFDLGEALAALPVAVLRNTI